MSDPIPVPPAIGLSEMVLEVANLAVSERFYAEDLGLQVVHRWEAERPATWLGLGGGSFLGLWPVETGGTVAIHGGRGGAHVHFAIRVPRGTLAAMQQRLESLGHEVEGNHEHGPGNLAIYLTDPDGHEVEITELATLWDGTPTES